jgi:hypothetical protein
MFSGTVEHHMSLYNLREIIGPEAEGVMVYGTRGCFYEQVYAAAEEHIQRTSGSSVSTKTSMLKPLKKVYDYSAGDESHFLEGLDDITPLPTIKYSEPCPEMRVSRQCKAGVTNIAVYNTIQKEQGEGTVPIIFCVKGRNFNWIDGCDWEVNEKTVLSKDSTLNEKITMKEIRRVGKLCFDEEIDPRVRRTAQQNVFFVEVTQHRDVDKRTNTEHYTYTLAKIPLPWGITNKSFDAFKQGLKQRTTEKETNPLERAIRRTSELSSAKPKLLKSIKSGLTQLIAKTKPEELTRDERQYFTVAFDWEAVLASDRTFTCFEEGVPMTLKQAFAKCLESYIKTPSFREQVNEQVQSALDGQSVD